MGYSWVVRGNLVQGSGFRVQGSGFRVQAFASETHQTQPEAPNPGLDYDAGDGVTVRIGTSVNELTSTEDRDFLAGTPWHKHVPARLERMT